MGGESRPEVENEEEAITKKTEWRHCGGPSTIVQDEQQTIEKITGLSRTSRNIYRENYRTVRLIVQDEQQTAETDGWGCCHPHDHSRTCGH